VNAEPSPHQGRDDLDDLLHPLASAHGADADPFELYELHAGLFVHLDAAEVVPELPPLDDGHPRELPGDRRQLEEVVDRSPLMLFEG